MGQIGYFARKVIRELLFVLGLIFGSKKYAKVVIVSRSRSGSNLLCSFLESHPQTFVWREVFRKPQYLTPTLTERLIGGRYLKRFRVVVYKVFYYHRVPDGYWERLIADERTLIIHLVRPNFLDTYVSRQQAVASGKWESFGGKIDRSSETSTTHVNIADLMAFLAENECLINNFAGRTRGRRNLLTLTFDQVAAAEGREMVASLLANHLDPSGFGVERNVRQGGSRLEDRISNFQEVQQAIAQSKWRHLLGSQHPLGH